MIYETFLDKGKTDTDRHWWVQAENVVGHANLYQHFDDEVAMQKALRCWDFIKQHLVNYKYGEWHWSVRADGTVNTDDDKGWGSGNVRITTDVCAWKLLNVFS